jgi:hypothetical protein
MNPRHAAALALVDWYLAMPPHIHRNGQVLVGVDRSPPLGQWGIADSFDTAAECQDAEGNLTNAQMATAALERLS